MPLRKRLLIVSLLGPCYIAAQAQTTFVRLVTNKGDVVVMLYDGTPGHRDMFVKEVMNGAYHRAEFNRVIKYFVSQAGALDDDILHHEKENPGIGVKRLPAELDKGYIHKRGALGAGRDDNPEKSSFYNQIYFVAGKRFTDVQLDELQQKNGKEITVASRNVYKSIGGTPHLDGNYTVFGEIVHGIEVAEQINATATDGKDVPVVPITFTAKVLSAKQARKFRKRTVRQDRLRGGIAD
jgi:cyclophilin family peptidyl-prolyl cis-trans isomerase